MLKYFIVFTNVEMWLINIFFSQNYALYVSTRETVTCTKYSIDLQGMNQRNLIIESYSHGHVITISIDQINTSNIKLNINSNGLTLR